ncbi:MAG: cell division protein ZapA [Hyphomicrobiaceae bacterium]|nr:cell division protein ZapA [Hyphomicrobiaceae bacterium]
MGQVTVTLNGRTYRLRCEDGEEQRLFALAEHVRGKLDVLVKEFGQIGDDRLMLMSALLVADELLDSRGQLTANPAQPDARVNRKQQRKPDVPEPAEAWARPDSSPDRKAGVA